MTTALEISSHRIRLVRQEQGRLVLLESYPVAHGSDPLEALAAAPLPRPLGPVRILMQHRDMMIQGMVQPPAPPDRLDSLIRFELHNQLGDEHALVAAWRPAPTAGAGDIRLLVAVSRHHLLEQLSKALAAHQGSIAGLTHPGVALYESWRRQHRDSELDGVLLDVGGANVHVAIVRGGELVLVRSAGVGAADLVQEIATLRGIPADEATRLLARLGQGAPDDLREVIRRCAARIWGSAQAQLRFANTQLRMEGFETRTVIVAGAGACIPGLTAALGERAGLPVHIHNPFADMPCQLLAEDVDRLSELPSPWSNVLGAALCETLPLDLCNQMREERRAWWLSTGALRLTAALALALGLAAVARQTYERQLVTAAHADLLGEDGLLPAARQLEQELAGQREQLLRTKRKAEILAQATLPGRSLGEVLGAVGHAIDPQTRRVSLRQIAINSLGDATLELRLRGRVEASGGRGAELVLDDFRLALQQHYTPITSLRTDNFSVSEFELTGQIGGKAAAAEPAAPADAGRSQRRRSR